MKLRRAASLVATSTLAVTALATTAPAQAHEEAGTRSLATVLAADGSGFDRRAGDFDILDNAVAAVLAAKPKSPVAVLADGSVPLTAFVPTDNAFRRLVEDLTGKRYQSERRVFTVLAEAAGIDTIENVLLYHVVPGATITYRQAKAANGAELTTALEGSTVEVMVRPGRVMLVDADTNDRNARVLPGRNNINVGNAQIAHGVNRVLRPIDLP